MKSWKIIGLLIILLSFFAIDVDAFDIYGTVQYANTSALNATNVTVKVYSFGATGPTTNSTYGALTNESGYFNVSGIVENSTLFYKPIIKHFNDTTNNFVDYIGPSLPMLPYSEVSLLSNMTFYVRAGATLNISAINGTGNATLFTYQVKDKTLGYPVDEEFSTYASTKLVHLPASRNYSVMIYPNQSFPVSADVNDTSLSDGLHEKQFNCTESQQRLTGYLNVSDGANFTKMNIISYILEPGRMIYLGANSMALYNFSSNDLYNLSTGFYNISVMGTAENSSMLIFAIANKSGEIYGGFKEISAYYGQDPTEVNLTLQKMLGDDSTITAGFGTQEINVTVKKQNITILNSSGIAINGEASIDLQLDYDDWNMSNFTYMLDIDSSNSGVFSVPILNVTGINKLNIFTQSGAPGKTKFTAAQVNAGTLNVTLKNSMHIEDPDSGTSTGLGDLFIDMVQHSSSCNVPNYNATACSYFGATQNMSGFNPFKVVMSGATLSFVMRNVNNITVHYVNVDLLASGPPDAAFDSTPANASGTSTFEQAWKFGSSGPEIYDYIIIAAPYTQGNSTQTGFNETQAITINIPYLYDENWNVIWNSSAGDNTTNISSSADLADYRDYLSHSDGYESFLNGTNVTCNSSDENLSAGLCYLDTANDLVWVKILHFSGLAPTIGGTIVTADSTTTTTTETSTSATLAETITNEVTLTHTFSNIVAHKDNVFSMDNSNMPLTQIKFKLDKSLVNSKLTAKSYDSKPAVVTAPSDDLVYRYVEISATNINNNNIESAYIEFEVEKSWIAGLNISKSDVYLLRWNDNKWNSLKTDYISGADNLKFRAETPGFSYFAIAGKDTGGTSTGTPETQEATAIADEIAQALKEIPAKAADTMAATVGFLVIVAGIIYFFYRKKLGKNIPMNRYSKFAKRRKFRIKRRK